MPAECLYEQRDSDTQEVFDQYTGSMYSEQSDLEVVREQFDWESGRPVPTNTLMFSLTKTQDGLGMSASSVASI